MRFSSVLAAVIIVLLVAAAAAGVLDFGTGIDADAWTYVAIFAHLLLLLGLTLLGRRLGNGMLLLLVAAAVLSLGQSMVALLWDFTAFNPLYRLRAPTANEFTRAAWWASAGTLALAFGVLLAGTALPTRERKSSNVAEESPMLLRAHGFVLGVVAVVLLVNFSLAATAGVGLAGAAGAGSRLAALANLFSRDLGMLLVLASAVRYWRRFSPSVRRATIATALLYVVVTLYQGSRGGLLLLVVMATVAAITEHGDFFLPRRALLAIVVAAAFTGVVLWPVATAIRTVRVLEGTPGAGVAEPSAPASPSVALSALTFVKPIAERQGRIPQLIAVVNDWVPGARNEVRASGILLNTIAGLFPGPNPDAETYPLIGRAYAVIYLQSPRDQIFAEEWSPTALMLFFLPTAAAVLALVAWGMVIAAATRLVQEGRSSVAYFCRVNFVYNMAFAMFAGAVFDVLAPQFIRWAVLGAAILALYHVLEQLSAAALGRGRTPLPAEAS